MVESSLTVILTIVLVIFGLVVIQAMALGFILTKWALGNIKSPKERKEQKALTEEQKEKIKRVKAEQEAFSAMLDTNIDQVYGTHR